MKFPTRSPRWPIAQTLVVGLVTFFVLTFLFLSALYARTIDWNAMRLAVTAGVAHGLPIYPSQDSGVVTGHIYPPMAAWVFLPAVLVSGTVDIQVFTAAMLAMSLVFGPLVLLGIVGFRQGINQLSVWLCVLVAALLVLLDHGMRYTAVMVHADGPAIGLAGLALLCASLAPTARSHRWILAGILAAAACSCKQTLLPTAILLGAVASFRYGLRAFLRAVVGMAIFSVITLGWLGITNQLSSFLYNTIELPSRHPWVTSGYHFSWGSPAAGQSLGERARAIVDVFIPLMQRTWPTLLIGTIAALKLPKAENSLHRFAAFAGMAAWLQLPLLLASSVKVGGDVNNQAPTPWFALAATLAFTVGYLRSREISSLARPALTAALLILTAANLPRFAFLCANAFNSNEPTAAMAKYLQSHPGTVYLPWNPLITYQVEGRRDHFEYGVFDRALAGKPISHAHFHAHLPPNIEYLALRTNQPNSAQETYRRYLTLKPAPSPVPGWTFNTVTMSA